MVECFQSCPTAVQENEEFWEQRERDQVNWLNELAVRENREFKLTLDPHKCPFGKWYDAFKNDDPVISGFLNRLAIPHERIHAVGGEVRALVSLGEVEAALALIDRSSDTTLSEVRRLFGKLRALARQQHREIAAALMSGGRTFGLRSIRFCPSRDFRPLTWARYLPGYPWISHRLVSRTARRPKTNELVLIPDQTA